MPHRRGRQPAGRLPHRRRGQQRPGVLERAASTATRRPRPSSSTAATQTGLRRGDARRSAPSTARPTRRSTSTSAFYDDLRTRFGAQRRAVRRGLRDRPRVRPPRREPAGRPRPGAGRRDRARRATPCGSSCMADCLAGVWAADAGRHRLHRGAHRRRHPRRPRRRRRRRRRPHPGAGQGRVDPESWTHGSAEQRQRVVPDRLPGRRSRRLRHLRRLPLERLPVQNGVMATGSAAAPRGRPGGSARTPRCRSRRRAGRR